MSIRIIKQGVLDVFYDQGRYGFQHLGVNPGGVMDTIAMKVANSLVGNHWNEALLEMHFPAAEILFEQDVFIAIAGADFTPCINNEMVPLHKPIVIKSGSLLTFAKPKSGARTYISVHGGFELESWLGSYSTDVLCRSSGYQGRVLKTGDVIRLKKRADYRSVLNGKLFKVAPFSANIGSLYNAEAIRILPGLHYEILNEVSRRNLITERFAITSNSNRMGYRLKAKKLELKSETNIISTGVTRGTIQLLPNGQLIILMADHQTTGGYPIVAHVVSADVASLAQCKTNAVIRFKLVDISEAEAALYQQQVHLLQLQNACNLRLKELL